MYQSPIEIIQGQIRMEQENNILRAVMEQEIHVDKHELLRALQYDRSQYEKGYEDAMTSIVRCKDCKHWWRHIEVNLNYGVCYRCHCKKHENGFCELGERINVCNSGTA